MSGMSKCGILAVQVDWGRFLQVKFDNEMLLLHKEFNANIDRITDDALNKLDELGKEGSVIRDEFIKNTTNKIMEETGLNDFFKVCMIAGGGLMIMALVGLIF